MHAFLCYQNVFIHKQVNCNINRKMVYKYLNKITVIVLLRMTQQTHIVHCFVLNKFPVIFIHFKLVNLFKKKRLK